MYHLRLGHSPVVAAAPSVFVPFAIAVAAMRVGILWAAAGLVGCVAIAAVLCKVLVTPPGNRENGEREELTGNDLAHTGIIN
mmetsp:Transcript_6564/g.9961  ORF Transcript_6564/g.9961 Transcript_6564/m.9961 type:complete len:82 (-) Transcript_6564:27-272(-)